MARCERHEQTYDQLKGEHCPYCGSPAEQHHHLKHVAAKLGVSVNTAREWFQDEPGVLRMKDKPLNSRKEARVHLRVPQRVLDRVLEKKSVVVKEKRLA